MILGARVSPTSHSQFPRSPEAGVSPADSLVTSVRSPEVGVTSVYMVMSVYMAAHAFFFDSVEGYPMIDARVAFADVRSRLLHRHRRNVSNML